MNSNTVEIHWSYMVMIILIRDILNYPIYVILIFEVKEWVSKREAQTSSSCSWSVKLSINWRIDFSSTSHRHINPMEIDGRLYRFHWLMYQIGTNFHMIHVIEYIHPCKWNMFRLLNMRHNSLIWWNLFTNGHPRQVSVWSSGNVLVGHDTTQLPTDVRYVLHVYSHP